MSKPVSSLFGDPQTLYSFRDGTSLKTLISDRVRFIDRRINLESENELHEDADNHVNHSSIQGWERMNDETKQAFKQQLFFRLFDEIETNLTLQKIKAASFPVDYGKIVNFMLAKFEMNLSNFLIFPKIRQLAEKFDEYDLFLETEKTSSNVEYSPLFIPCHFVGIQEEPI